MLETNKCPTEKEQVSSQAALTTTNCRSLEQSSEAHKKALHTHVLKLY